MGTPLTTQRHEWVAITMAPVELIANDEGEPVFVDSLDEGAEARTVYGCRLCDAPSEGPEALEECVPNGDNI